jgi:hypothetical protein
MPITFDHTPMALEFGGTTATYTQNLHSLAWCDDAWRLLREIGDRAGQTARQTGTSFIHLPFVALWTSFQLSHDGWISLARDVGTKQPAFGNATPKPFAYLGGSKVDVDTLTDTVARWIDGTLTRFVQKYDVPFVAISSLRELCRTKRILSCKEATVQLFPWNGVVPEQLPYAVAPGELAAHLAGHEIFPGLGPVVRVIGGPDNTAELMTLPVTAAGGQFSLVCQLSLQTIPGAREPAVHLNFIRRRWATTIERSPLKGKSIGGYVFTSERPHQAFRFDLVLDRDQCWRADAAYQELELAFGLTRGYDNESIVAYPRQEGAQVLIMHSAGLAVDKSSKLEAGVPVADQLAAYRRVLEILAPAGFRAFSNCREVKGGAKGPKRIEVLRAPMILHSLMASSTDEATPDEDQTVELDRRVVELTKRSLSEWFGKDRPALDQRYTNLAGVVADLVRASGLATSERTRTLCVLVQSAAEKPWIEAVVRLMLGDSVKLLVGEVPRGAHGPSRQLSPNIASRAERMHQRMEIWRRFAHDNGLDEDTMVLVQADDWYSFEGKRLPDDSVNKAACRRALADEVGATVQYLLPAREHKLDNYLMRLQAALLDLVYGHSGSILGLPAAVTASFPVPSQHPTHVVAIGSISVDMGTQQGTVLAALRYDVTAGRPMIRLAHMESEAAITPWMPFGEGLRYVARRPRLMIGKQAAASTLFQQFLATVLDDTAAIDPNAVVFLHSIRGVSLWKKLADKHAHIGAQLLDGESAPRVAWVNLRLIRVREQAPTMVNVRTDGPLLPSGQPLQVATTVKRLFAVDGALAPTYWSYGPPGQQKRGTSCYRSMLLPGTSRTEIDQFPPVYGQHQTPRGTEFVVLQAQQDDDPHQLARFSERLRLGVVQARGDIWVKVPSPLYAIGKLADYMRY